MPGEDKSKNFKGKPRRPRKNFKKGAGPKGPPKAAGSKGSGARGSGRGSKNRKPKALTPARILQKYDNLLEQHIVARRKFYEMHGRVQGRQLEKIESNFYKTAESLRLFETGLKDWQLDVLKEKIDAYPRDLQYSKSRELEPKGEEVPFSGDFEDPHLLPTQKESDFSDDTEESVGTIEDYKSYKELS
ncbi:MAG: hypothetical protein WD025_01205 [Bacteriovoracaceae bacterium]